MPRWSASKTPRILTGCQCRVKGPDITVVRTRSVRSIRIGVRMSLFSPRKGGEDGTVSAARCTVKPAQAETAFTPADRIDLGKILPYQEFRVVTADNTVPVPEFRDRTAPVSHQPGEVPVVGLRALGRTLASVLRDPSAGVLRRGGMRAGVPRRVHPGRGRVIPRAVAKRRSRRLDPTSPRM